MSDSETTRQRTFAGLLQRGSWPERFDELADTHGVPYAQRYFIEGAPLRYYRTVRQSCLVQHSESQAHISRLIQAVSPARPWRITLATYAAIPSLT